MIQVNGTAQPLILANMTSLATKTFTERVEVAAAAGFDGMGLSLETWRHVVAHELSPLEAKTVLEVNGIQVMELEAVYGFAIPVEQTGPVIGGGLEWASTSPQVLREFWTLAEMFGTRLIHTVGRFDGAELEPDVVERFADLCDQAAQVGLHVGLEYVPISNIPDAATALDIVEQAGRPNGGLSMDSWHHFRGANDLDQLRAIPAERVKIFQVNDGSAEPKGDFVSETRHHRAVPGTGDWDLASWVEALTAGGATAPVSVEVISDYLATLAPADAAKRCYDGARAMMADKA